MTMLNTLTRIVALAACAGSLLILSACGGGSEGGAAGLAYSGPTDLVVITPDNADQVATQAYTQGSGAQGVGSTEGSLPQVNGRALSGPEAAGRVARAAVTLTQPQRGARAAFSQRSTMAAECSTGSATITMSGDDEDETAPFTLAITYNNFCITESGAGEMTMNGSMTMVSDLAQDRLTITFDQLYMAGFGMDGAVVVDDLSGDTLNMTLNMLIEGTDGQVYRYENFGMIMAFPADGSLNLSMNGRFYDPGLGAMDITTEVPFVIAEGAFLPSAGVMRVEGANGFVRLSANADGTYDLAADTDGDSQIDVNEYGLTWRIDNPFDYLG